MSLQADLAALHRGPRTFDQWREQATAEDVALVMDAIMDVAIRPEALETALRNNGIPITVTTIGKLRGTR